MSGSPRKRGRLPTAEIEARKEEIIGAAMAELAEHGFGGVTMLGIARRAGASKETLYAWFGSREGLFGALIEAQAAATNAAVDRTLATDAQSREVLIHIAKGLLALLTGERSVALNRAAMTSPELATLLLTHGRNTTGPRIVDWLARHRIADRDGVAVDPEEAFELLYALTMRDRQIQTLLGADPPTPAEIEIEADRAVRRFLQLVEIEPVGA